MTKWPNDHYWPHFRQKAYSGGIPKLIQILIHMKKIAVKKMVKKMAQLIQVLEEN